MEEELCISNVQNAKIKVCIMYITVIEHFERKINETSLESWSIQELEERLLALSHYQTQWDMAVVNIAYAPDIPDKYSSYLISKTIPIEETCIRLRTKLKTRMSQLEAKQPRGANQRLRNTQLMQLNVTQNRTNSASIRFSGRYCDWPKFKADFEQNVVSSTTFANDKKLAVLKERLPEEALLLVEDINCFKQAWKNVVMRYDRPNNQILEVTEKLMRMPPIQYTSNFSIKNAIIDYEGIVASFAMLEVDMAPIITSMIITQMDASILITWQRFLKANLGENFKQYDEGSYIPSWPEISAFLQAQMQVNDERNAEASQRHTQSSSSLVAPPRSVQAPINLALRIKMCFYGCAETHKLYKCNAFISERLKVKWAFIINNAICVRCLDEQHAGACKNKSQNSPCPNCQPLQRYHNSCLCPKRHSNEQQAELMEEEEEPSTNR